MFFLRYLHFIVLSVIVLSAGCAHVRDSRSDAMPARRANVPILLYHHIADLPDTASSAQKRWTISPGKFDEHMLWIFKHGFHPVTMAQLTSHLKHGLPLPAKPIVITFDDGWKDQYFSALPILKKYNFPATFFIITGSVGHSAYMNWNQVLELSELGMDIESHSVNHDKLSILPLEKVRPEIEKSKKILEEKIHKPVTVFAYPYGGYSDGVIDIVKDAGFESAVSVSGLNDGYLFRADQSYILPRYAIESGEKLSGVSQLKRARDPAVSSLFVSLVQEPSIFSNRKNIKELVNFASSTGINTLFIQVYRENKAWFPSQTADSSPYEICRNDLSEDPLALIIRLAHQKGIQVHAWLNLLSLTQNQGSKFLKQYGTDILTRDVKKKDNLRDYLIDSQYFLEPGDYRVRQDLAKIVGELLGAYPELDGVQFDYIRYPDKDPHYGYTKKNIERFKKSAGVRAIDDESLVWKNWKRAQVTELLDCLVKAARNQRPGIQVSATGCMPYARAYYEAYQDWLFWIDKGLVDFVIIMDYSADPVEFRRWLKPIKEKLSDPSKVKVSVGAYKLVKDPEIFDREFRYAEEFGITTAVFHYGSLLENPRLASIIMRKNKR